MSLLKIISYFLNFLSHHFINEYGFFLEIIHLRNLRLKKQQLNPDNIGFALNITKTLLHKFNLNLLFLD